MRFILIILFIALIHQIDGHGQHASGNSQSSSGGQPHVARKMEDYVHDMESDSLIYKILINHCI